MGSKPEQDSDNACDLTERVYVFLRSSGNEVTNLLFSNDDMLWVSWKHSDDNITAGKNVNVAISDYLTTQARLKLYEYLSGLWESILYCDTVIFIQNVD